ncbi:MAG TPA: biotin/lipoyl-binding protein [Pirellulales bacterium]|nr:biotin/lipoyl-binding protein [Pirellulales bacterium]
MHRTEAAANEEEGDRSAAPARRHFWTDPHSGNQYFVALQQDDENPKAEAAGTANGVHVTVAKAERIEFPVTTTQPASLIASRELEIHSRVAGFIAECDVETGDRVKQGELLALIEAPDLDAEIERAEDAAEEAAAERERAEAVLEVAGAAIEANRANVGEAEAAVAATWKAAPRAQRR